MKRLFSNLQFWVVVAIIAGIICGYFPFPGQEKIGEFFLQLFMNALKLVSLPVIFLSLLCAFCGMENLGEVKWLGKKVISLTLFTTVMAATVALGLFLWIDPAVQSGEVVGKSTELSGNYLSYLAQAIPTHIFQPFMEGNVVAALFLATALGLALFKVSGRQTVHTFLAPILQAFMKMTAVVCYFIPLLVFSSIVVSFKELQDGVAVGRLFSYLACIIGANVLQAIIVLPAILKWHGIRPWSSAKGFFPALTMAFFSKSSVATLPMAMQCAEKRLQVSPKVSQFTFPLCTTINMNGCAAFILTTVLFVSMNHGVTFPLWQMVGWIFIATLAAVGNAGIPMGCFFLSSALLASMDIPLGMMALILPFYSLIDMLETAINVWSDGCVALIVQKKFQESLVEELSNS